MDQEQIVRYYEHKWQKPLAARGVSAILRQRCIHHFIQKHKGKANLELLDLGCGKGYLAESLNRYGKVTAVDYAEKTIELNKRRAPSIEFFCADVADPDLPEHLDTYDVVVSSEVIEHLPVEGRAVFVKNLERLLRSDGLLVITTPYQETLLKLKPSGVSRKAFLTGLDDQPIDNIMTKQELLDVLQPEFSVLEFTSVQPLVKPRALDLLWKAIFLPINYRLVNRFSSSLGIDGKYMVVACKKN